MASWQGHKPDGCRRTTAIQALLRAARSTFHNLLAGCAARAPTLGRDICRGGQAPLFGKLMQRLFERSSSPVQAAHDGADRHFEDFGDLLVRETLDVGQQDGQAERLRERLDGRL